MSPSGVLLPAHPSPVRSGWPADTALRLSDHEACLVSSLPPFQNVTPNPLHLRTSAGFTIEQAIHSVLALTLLHFGSLKLPRLPVTVHYSDEIAYLALQGIKPKHLEGSVPYWLGCSGYQHRCGDCCSSVEQRQPEGLTTGPWTRWPA